MRDFDRISAQAVLFFAIVGGVPALSYAIAAGAAHLSDAIAWEGHASPDLAVTSAEDDGLASGTP